MNDVSRSTGPFTAESYIETRIETRIAYYDKRAVLAKRLHYLLDGSAMLLTVVLLLLIPETWISRSELAVIAALVTVIGAIERLAGFGDRWLLYRMTAEELQSEVQLFRHSAGPYTNAPDGARLLVERTEKALYREAGRWRNSQSVGESTLTQKLAG